jgi:hypothetical protein
MLQQGCHDFRVAVLNGLTEEVGGVKNIGLIDSRNLFEQATTSSLRDRHTSIVVAEEDLYDTCGYTLLPVESPRYDIR